MSPGVLSGGRVQIRIQASAYFGRVAVFKFKFTYPTYLASTLVELSLCVNLKQVDKISYHNMRSAEDFRYTSRDCKSMISWQTAATVVQASSEFPPSPLLLAIWHRGGSLEQLPQMSTSSG